MRDSYRELLDENQQINALEKFCVYTLPPMQSPVELPIITARNMELRRLMNKAAPAERIEVISPFGSMAEQHCIAKDGIHPNKRGVETITELYRSDSNEQTAGVGKNELQDLESKVDEEQPF